MASLHGFSGGRHSSAGVENRTCEYRDNYDSKIPIRTANSMSIALHVANNLSAPLHNSANPYDKPLGEWTGSNR